MRHKNGQSLMEVIIAATVGILVVSALTFATIFSLRNASFSKASAQATKLAQEGIERVRTGRNRNAAINGLSVEVTSWSGDASGEKALWDYQITGALSCDNPTTGGKCYFNVNSDGQLTQIGGFASLTLPPQAEPIPPQFRRAVTLSDDANYQNQKKVTVIVTWTDSSGPHESKLTTILGKKF